MGGQTGQTGHDIKLKEKIIFMSEKEFDELVEERYTKIAKKKTISTYVITGIVIILLSIIGMFVIADFLQNRLPSLRSSILLAASLYVNLFLLYLLQDRKE